MVIKNITNKEIEIIGVSLDAGAEMAISDIGSAAQLRLGTDEIVENVLSGNVIISYSDGVAEPSIQKIVDILDNKNVETTVNIDNASVSSNGSDMYYYQNVTRSMAKGEEVSIKFVGYLDNVVITSKSGTVEFQIVEPKMNKIQVHSLNSFSFDAKNNIKDAVIRLTAVTAVTVTIMMDGLYDESSRKSKVQYLEEIYSDSSVVEVDIEDKVEKGMLFSCPMDKPLTLLSGSVKDYVSGSIGVCKGFTDSNEFNGSASIEFDPGISVQADKPFTISLVFEQNDSTHLQYLLYKLGQYYVYVSNGSMYVNVCGRSSKVCKVRTGTVTHLAITYDGITGQVYVYVNGLYATTITTSMSVRNYGYPMLVGNRSTTTKYGLKGVVHLLQEYNYAMSGGLISGLYDKYMTTTVDKEVVPGNMVAYYSTGNRGTNHIDSFAEFDTVEKMYANGKYALYSEVMPSMDSANTGWSSFKTKLNYLTVIQTVFRPSVSGYYTYEVQGDDAVELTVNNKVICADYGGHGVRSMKEGSVYMDSDEEYLVKFRHYQGTGGTAYKCMVKVPESTDFIEVCGVLPDRNKHVIMSSDDLGYIVPTPTTDTRAGDNLVSGSSIVKLQSNSKFNTRLFTMSLWLNLRNYKETRVFSIGSGVSNWATWLGMEVDNKVLKVLFNKKSVKSKKILHTYEWNKVDIASDGTTIKVYVNSVLIGSMTYDDRDEYRGTDVYINALPDGSQPKWLAESSYYIKDMVYADIYTTAEEVKHKYLEEIL